MSILIYVELMRLNIKLHLGPIARKEGDFYKMKISSFSIQAISIKLVFKGKPRFKLYYIARIS